MPPKVEEKRGQFPLYDVIVVGAGIMGASTSYQIARRGKKVLLLEQFKLLHDRGSSHGASRITRLTYPEPQFANLMPSAYRLWEQAEQESGTKVFTKTGGLDFGKPDNPDLHSLIQNLKDAGIKHEIMTGKQANQRFPLRLPDNFLCIYQADSGILHPTNSVNMYINLAKKYGATVQDQEKMLGLERVSPNRVNVYTNKAMYVAQKVVITSGPWIKKLLTPLGVQLPPIEIWKQTFAFFPVKPEFKQKYQGGTFPVFINYEKEGFYGFPINEVKDHIKVASHFRGWVEIVDPDTRTMQPNAKQIEIIKQKIKENFEGVDTSYYVDPCTCLYTMTPNSDYIIDFLPNGSNGQFDNIVIAGGFSGHGFKVGSVIGYILSRLALDSMCPEFYSELKHFQLPQNKARREQESKQIKAKL